MTVVSPTLWQHAEEAFLSRKLDLVHVLVGDCSFRRDELEA